MRRTATLALICCAGALGATAGTASAATPVASVVQRVCHSDVAPLDRQVLYVGAMDSLRSGNTMEMRFDLFTKTAQAPTWQSVQVPELGIWNRAMPNRSGYRFKQKVANLSAPASYRVRVTFRWLGPKKQKTVQTRWSPVCVQRDPRANLRVARITADALKGSMAMYHVFVRNVGSTAVGGPNGFDVALAVDGVTQPARSIAGLGAGQSVQVDFKAPRCTAGGTVQATVDPDQRVDQGDRTDDVLQIPCPAKLT